MNGVTKLTFFIVLMQVCFVSLANNKIRKQDCAKIVAFRDAELVDLLDNASFNFNEHKLKLYLSHKKLLLETIQTIENDKPWISADGTLLLNSIELLSSRFIDLTSSLIPGGATKAIGFGYATFSDIAKGALDANKTMYLVLKDGISNQLNENVSGALSIALSTGSLVSNVKDIGDKFNDNKNIERETKNIIISIKKEVKKYDALIARYKNGKKDFVYLNELKNWIDKTCN